jgi:predicted transcriptional regulator
VKANEIKMLMLLKKEDRPMPTTEIVDLVDFSRATVNVVLVDLYDRLLVTRFHQGGRRGYAYLILAQGLHELSKELRRAK